MFLEQPSSGTLKVKRLKNQIILSFWKQVNHIKVWINGGLVCIQVKSYLLATFCNPHFKPMTVKLFLVPSKLSVQH